MTSLSSLHRYKLLLAFSCALTLSLSAQAQDVVIRSTTSGSIPSLGYTPTTLPKPVVKLPETKNNPVYTTKDGTKTTDPLVAIDNTPLPQDQTKQTPPNSQTGPLVKNGTDPLISKPDKPVMLGADPKPSTLPKVTDVTVKPATAPKHDTLPAIKPLPVVTYSPPPVVQKQPDPPPVKEVKTYFPLKK